MRKHTKDKKRRELVMRVINAHPETLDNDNLLIAYCLIEEYKTADMTIIATKTTTGLCEAYTRQRRKIQETNPNYKSTETIQIARMNSEKEYRDYARGI